jgi:cytoskeletal protein RodZ
MEGLGKKLQEARLARNLTIDEAARITKIRPARLQEIENEDFSEFPSLAYAKGFLMIYGKFLDVDVSPYLEAFETSDSVTVDGYSYLQDNPAPTPSRPAVTRRQSARTTSSPAGGRGSFIPFLIGVVVLVFGFIAMKWILEVQRLKPGPRTVIGASPTPVAETIIAPKAALVEQAPTPIPPPPSPQPSVIPASPIPQPTAAEPEVRRAEPVHAEDVPKAKPVASAPVRRILRTPVPNAGPRPSLTPRPVPR